MIFRSAADTAALPGTRANMQSGHPGGPCNQGEKFQTRPPVGVRMAGARVNPRSVMLIGAWMLVPWRHAGSRPRKEHMR